MKFIILALFVPFLAHADFPHSFSDLVGRQLVAEGSRCASPFTGQKYTKAILKQSKILGKKALTLSFGPKDEYHFFETGIKTINIEIMGVRGKKVYLGEHTISAYNSEKEMRTDESFDPRLGTFKLRNLSANTLYLSDSGVKFSVSTYEAYSPLPGFASPDCVLK